jgi:Holliday junction resolvasome RuvABC endonuclease subunit
MGREKSKKGNGVKSFSSLKDVRILGIDPSTKSLAWGLCRFTGQGDIVFDDAGLITLPKQEGMGAIVKTIVDDLPDLVKETRPDAVFIEQTVYIQNFQTSRVLSYVVGAAMAAVAFVGVPITEASPLSWKTGIGYKKVMKKDIIAWSLKMGEKEAKKKASFERKNRVRHILVDRLGEEFSDTDRYDVDMVDAVGIAMWGCQQRSDEKR